MHMQLSSKVSRYFGSVVRRAKHTHRFQQQHAVVTKNEQQSCKGYSESAIRFGSQPAGEKQVQDKIRSRRETLVQKRGSRLDTPKLKSLTTYPRWEGLGGRLQGGAQSLT